MSADQTIQEAISKARADRIDEARDLLFKITGREPTNARAWFLLSQIAKNHEQALYCISKAQEAAPGNARIREKLEELRAIPLLPAPPRNLLEERLKLIILALILLVLLLVSFGFLMQFQYQ